jgi:RNA polymerase sigma-70 factor (ECF subfamily)
MYSSTYREDFIQILEIHKGILYKIINSYCRPIADRKDLEQEIVIALWKSLPNYNQAFQLSTFIYKIALNVAISFYRNDSKIKKTITTVDEWIFLVPELDESEHLKNQTTLLYQFINQLDEFDKATIILYLEEKSYREIAEIIGISESNVGTRISRIKKKLKERFTNLNE